MDFAIYCIYTIQIKIYRQGHACNLQRLILAGHALITELQKYAKQKLALNKVREKFSIK